MKSTQADILHAGKLAIAIFFSFLAGQAVAQTAAQTGSNFIHGSWVNVREAADANARVIDKLVTNTPVDVLAALGSWCQLSYGVGKTGFSSCNLLGASALTLAQTTTQPARAFWVAPSPNRLVAYGQSLSPPAYLQREVLDKTHKPGDVVRYPPVPEFDAAKKIMKAGVRLDAANEIDRGAAVDMAKEMDKYAIKPAPIRPSFFRTHQSVALVSETDADGLAAVAGSVVSVVPEGLPKARCHPTDCGPIEGTTGFWDVGMASLNFPQPMVIYSVTAFGLVGATAVSKLPFDINNPQRSCGAHYLGKSLPLENYQFPYEKNDYFEYVPVRGYPALKDITQVLTSFALPQAFQRQSVKIKTKSQSITRPQTDYGPDYAAKFKELKPELISREIDLDGDGVADVMQLETPIGMGEVNHVGVIFRRTWYVNINGEWFKAGDWEDQDCT